MDRGGVLFYILTVVCYVASGGRLDCFFGGVGTR